MAQAARLWPLTAEVLVRALASSCGICGRQSGTGTVFSPACLYSTIAPYSSTTAHEVCDSSDQAAHYHTLGLKLGALSLTQHLVDLGAKWYYIYFLSFCHRLVLFYVKQLFHTARRFRST
jgi:hypothetical protein